MVEIVLALAVIALGVTASMAILQPSAVASRDSVGDNYSADMAKQFMSYIEAKARQDWTTVVGTSTTLSSAPPQTPPTMADTNTDNPANWSSAVGSGNIYTSGGSLSASSGIYGGKIGTDFAGHIRVWKKQVNDFSYGTSSTALPTDKAVRICIEVSYPVMKPYKVRDKRFFSMEIFNQ